MMRFSRRSLLIWGLIVIPLLLTAVLLGPTLVARAQVNLFSIGLARLWSPDILQPTENACSRVASSEALDDLGARLTRADGADAHLALHQGQLACLEGDVDRAGDIWQAALDSSDVLDPVLLLNTAIARFARGEILENVDGKEIGQYAFKQGLASEREKDTAAAKGWYEMAFAYVRNGDVGTKLAALYDELGDKEAEAGVWQRLKSMSAEDSSQYWWGVARLAELERDWAEAASAYHQAAEYAGLEDAYKFLLREGKMWLQAKKYQQAEAAYQRAVDLEPDRIAGYLGIASVFRAQKRYDEAIAWYEKAREKFPKDYRPPYYLGLSVWGKTHDEEALRYIDHALMLKPNNPTVLYNKSIVLDELSRRREAIETLSQAIALSAHPPESWRNLLALWQRYPDYARSPDRWWERGQAAEKEKDWAQAAAIYAEGASKAQPPDDYRLLDREALMHRYLTEWDKAAAIYEDLVQRYPDRIEPYLGLGEAARQQRRWGDAIYWYARAQELFPDDYRPSYYLGVVALAQDRLQDALTYLNQSLALKPDNPGALYYKALVLDALERREDALPVLKQAIHAVDSPPQSWLDKLARWQTYPTNDVDPAYWAQRARKSVQAEDWQHALADYEMAADLAVGKDAYPYWLRVGDMRLRLKDYDGAEAAYRQALAIDEQSLEGLLGLGHSFRMRGDLKTAETWYRQAQAQAPDDHRPYYYLGIVALSAKRFDEALSWFEQAQSIQPDNPYILYYQAVTLKALGRLQDAIDALSRAIELHSHPPNNWKNLLEQWKNQT